MRALLSGSAARRMRLVVSATSLSLVAALLVVLAFNSDGIKSVEAELDDGSVWVSRPGEIGRLNKPIKQLDRVVDAPGMRDVVQDGNTVLIDAPGMLTSVDVAAGQEDAEAKTGANTLMSMGGGVVALVDQKSGQAWVLRPDAIDGFSPKSTPAVVTSAKGGLVAVTPAGVAYVLRPESGDAVPMSIDGVGAPDAGEPIQLAESLSSSANLQFTVVGNLPVLLDGKAKQLYRPRHDPTSYTTAAPADVKLQLASIADDAIHLATREGLWATNGLGGDLRLLDDGHSGRPAAPAILDGCVHAAWAEVSPNAYTRECGKDSYSADLDGMEALADSARLVFRINRSVIVLNDVESGLAWLVQNDPPDPVNDWDRPKQKDQRTKQTEKELKKPERDKNRPPSPENDEFGARPGTQEASRATVLPVLINDTDPDGDVLAIVGKPKVFSGIDESQVDVVGNDTQLQVRLGPNDREPIALRYTVDDGEEQKSANVKVSVVPSAADNQAPKPDPSLKPLKQPTTMTVARGATSSMFVLPDWFDPEGDDIALAGAEPEPASLGQVSFRPDGTLTLAAASDAPDSGAIVLRVEDSSGLANKDEKVRVRIVDPDESVPELVADRARGIAGDSILVEPLLNDRVPDGAQLKLSSVSGEPKHLEIETDPEAGTFTATTEKPGTYVLRYKAETGAQTATSKVRLDVMTARTNKPPVAVKDTALVRPGGTTVVDPLANDYDPDEDVIVVTAVEAPQGVKASLQQNRQLIVEADSDLSESDAVVSYSIADGNGGTAKGSVSVTAAPSGPNRAPTAEPDEVRVRSGAITTIDVLANDLDLDGDRLQLVPGDIELVNSFRPWKDGVLFTSGRTLRVRAPREPGEYHAIYGIRDPEGQRDSAEVIVTVSPDDEAGNRAPQPKPVVARAVTGRSQRIDLALRDADDDGDAVSVTRILKAPTNGRILQRGLDWVEYDNPDVHGTGTDRFEVEVTDRYGATGTVDVSVGVAARESTNQPPVALNDELLVRPGRALDYRVTTNDVDPDGDPITVLTPPTLPPGLKATLDSTGRLGVRSPTTVKSVAIGYRVTDQRGGTDSATFTVVSDDNAPLHYPVTKDDTADVAEIAGKSPGQWVTVLVRDNDSDLDGSRDRLTVGAIDAGTKVDGNKLKVELEADDRVVAYSVTDRDGNTSYGFVYVSGTDNVPPVLNPKKEVPYVVTTGEPVELDLNAWVLVRGDRRPRLANESTLAAQHGKLEAKGLDRIVYTPDDGYAGPARLEFEVVDGDERDDDRLTSLLSLPVDVVPDAEAKPSVRGATVDVAPGGEATIDLDGLATAANPDHDLRYRATADRETGWLGVDTSKSRRHLLTVHAQDSAPVGHSGLVTFEAMDGSKRDSAEVTVKVVRHTEPLISLPSVIEVEGKVGSTEDVDIADYATSLIDGASLRVAAGDHPDARVSVVPTSTIRVTPRQHGRITVPFTVTDDPDDMRSTRTVRGRLVVTAAARPGQMEPPTVSNVQAKSVVLAWSAPDDFGAPIDKYEVRSNDGHRSTCKKTTCSIDGLSSGTKYTFQVRAHNSVDFGEWSRPSFPETPNAVPDTMAAPRVVVDPARMDRQLTLTWAKPRNEGSPITTYEIQYDGKIKEVTGENTLRTTIPGLQNGTGYSFAIRAVNDKGPARQFSARSGAVKPFGKPLAVPNVKAEPTKNREGGGKEIKVTWSAAPDNGDPISAYRIQQGPGGTSVTVTGGVTSRPFAVENGVSYTYTVTAQNRAGAGPPTTSAAALAYGPANAPTITGKGPETDGHGVVQFTTPTDNGGTPVTQYQVQLSDGGQTPGSPYPAQTKSEGASTSLNVNFGGNKMGGYKIRLIPMSDNGTLAGAQSDSITISPHGKPNPPTVDAQRISPTRVRLSWTAPTVLNGREIASAKISVNGGAWEPVAKSGHVDRGASYGESWSIRAIAVDEASGESSPSATAKASTASPSVHVEYTGSSACLKDENGVEQCEDLVRGYARGLSPNTSYQVTFRDQNGTKLSGIPVRTKTTNSSGDWDSPNPWSNVCGRSGAQFYVTFDNVESNRVSYRPCGS